MTELLKTAGSFTTIMLATWLFLFILLCVSYPLIRRFLFKWHPATSSNLILILLSFPFLTSLISTTLLFSPFLESSLFSDHIHTADCYEHFPYLNSFWLIYSVLAMATLLILTTFKKFLLNLKFSKNLKSQLSSLSKEQDQWHLLPQQESLVFTLGWLKNTIFITQGLIQKSSSQDINIILEHEKEHVKRKDNLRLLLARLLTIFIPGKLSKRYIDDLHLFTEAACDQSSASKYGSLNVAETLLKVQKLVPDHFDYFNQTLISSFTGSEIEDRVQLLIDSHGSGKTPRFKIIFGVGALLLISLFFVDPLHHSVEWLLTIF